MESDSDALLRVVFSRTESAENARDFRRGSFLILAQRADHAPPQIVGNDERNPCHEQRPVASGQRQA